MKYVRVNKLLREQNLTVERLAELIGIDTISPNDKLGIVDNSQKERMIVHTDMDSETLLAVRDAINNELNGRLSEMKANYLEFKDKVKNHRGRE